MISLADGKSGWINLKSPNWSSSLGILWYSKNISILEIANKYKGGGHKFANGGRLSSLEELNNLLFDCDNLINANIHSK